jgi:hypothetical protein
MVMLVPAPEWLKQEYLQLKASLGYIQVSSSKKIPENLPPHKV